MIAENQESNSFESSVFCTEEMEEEFNRIAHDLKSISAWFHMHGLEGEEVPQQEWQKRISHLGNIATAQGKICEFYEGLSNAMIQDAKERRGEEDV